MHLLNLYQSVERVNQKPVVWYRYLEMPLLHNTDNLHIKVCNISDIDVIITDSSIKPAVLHKYRAFVDIVCEENLIEK